jgi:DNA-binding transcriptional ArsR family regulator
MGEWVYRTAAALSPEARRTNRHVLQGAASYLGGIVWPSFEAWVDDLACQDPAEIRNVLVRALFAKAYARAGRDLPSREEVIADRTLYLSMLDLAFPGEGQAGERALWEDAYGEFVDPPLVQERIVTHLRTIWAGGLRVEWERHLPVLEESVHAYSSLDLRGLSALEAVIRVSMRDIAPPIGHGWLDAAEHLVLIPSAHCGPYLLHLEGLDERTVRVVYGARVPDSGAHRSPALTRSELLIRLSALANDTRLRVLQLVGQSGELSTAEIMERLELSQSAASRHLEHLSATGYLTVRGDGRAKLYALSAAQIDRTLDALKAFCRP